MTNFLPVKKQENKQDHAGALLLACTILILRNNIIRDSKMVLIKYLKGRDDIALGDASHGAEVLDAEGAPEVPEDLE